jgi:hypothetical protein
MPKSVCDGLFFSRVAISLVDKVSADDALDDQYDIAYETAEECGPIGDATNKAEESEEAPAAKRSRLANDAYAFPSEYRCPLCQEEFPAAWSLNVHMRTKHLERSHHCSWCNKNFATITDLDQHTLVHQVQGLRTVAALLIDSVNSDLALCTGRTLVG